MTAQWLCEAYAERVYRFAALVSRGNSEAEDIAQDALERAIRNIHRFDATRGTADGWLWSIVVRAAADAGRADNRRTRIFLRLIEDRHADDDADVVIDDDVTDEALLDAVRRLKSRDRTMLALRFGADLPYREIGRLLGLSEAAVGISLRRILKRLKRELDPREGGRP